jgi:chemotaxis protein CheX
VRQKSSKPRTLRLPARLDLTATAPLAQSLLDKRGSALVVDAGRVERVGAQCFQVLLAAVATWKADGLPLRIATPSDEFAEAARLLGIAPAELMIEDATA